MIKISERLMTVASLVSRDHVLADVGTDHGYVPIYLILQGKIKKAIAMDINRGPLERAREHISLYGMGDYIETRLSDGVEALALGEADSILIAGMGGGLVIRIEQRTEGKADQRPDRSPERPAQSASYPFCVFHCLLVDSVNIHIICPDRRGRCPAWHRKASSSLLAVKGSRFRLSAHPEGSFS